VYQKPDPIVMPHRNRLSWQDARIHGELLKLGFEVAQSSVAKYMVKRRGHQARDA